MPEGGNASVSRQRGFRAATLLIKARPIGPMRKTPGAWGERPHGERLPKAHE